MSTPLRPSPSGSSSTNRSKNRLKSRTSTVFFCVLCCSLLVALLWSSVLLVFHHSNNLDQNYDESFPSLASLSPRAYFSSFSNPTALLLQGQSASRELQNLLEQEKSKVRDLQQQLLRLHLQQEARQPVAPSLVQSTQVDLRNCQQQQQQQGDQSFNSLFNAPAFVHQNPVCQALPHPIPSPAAIWTQFLPQIHKASQIPNDHRFYFHDFTAQLLHLVSPRLPASVKSLPRDHLWNKVDEILHVAHRRYQYIQNPDAFMGQTPPRPVKILIMGGSLLVGMNCRKLVGQLGFQLRLPLADCSWANRLEKIINQALLGKPLSMAKQKQLETHYIVDVNKVAMGGTNTETGTIVLEYDLMPPEAKNPDIIINAYATNDMHIITMLEAQSGNATLRDKVFDMVQDFARRVMEPPPINACSDSQQQQHQHQLAPLLVHMDDYLGNEQREIWATTELSQSVQVLANYYGFASASYADIARDFVYGDTKEFWFSPQGWYDDSGNFEREIHPNMGMHIIAAWVIAYNFLNMVTTFCSLEGWNLHQIESSSNRRMEYNNTILNHLPELNGKFWPPGKPKAPPQGLPPPLDMKLSLEHITELWKLADASQKKKLQQDSELSACEDHQPAVKCPFSWLSGISSTLEKPKVAEAYFREHTTFSGDWTFEDDHGKLGIVPHALMSPLGLELSHLSQQIRKVTIFYMKSYGPKWAGSRVRIECWRNPHNNQAEWEVLQTHEFVGWHKKNTSETYTDTIDLSKTPVDRGASLRVRVVLIDGSTFKIMGFAVCI